MLRQLYDSFLVHPSLVEPILPLTAIVVPWMALASGAAAPQHPSRGLARLSGAALSARLRESRR